MSLSSYTDLYKSLPKFGKRKTNAAGADLIKNPGDPGYVDVIDKIAKIGNGATGISIYGWRCAVKELWVGRNTDTNKRMGEMKREIETLARLTREAPCSFIPKFLGAQFQNDKVLLFLTLYDQNLHDLLERLHREEHHLSETVIARYCAQILIAVKQMHTRFIAHRDLKSRNILCSGIRPRVDEANKFCVFPPGPVYASFNASGVEDRSAPLPCCLVVSNFGQAKEFNGLAEASNSQRDDIRMVCQVMGDLMTLEPRLDRLKTVIGYVPELPREVQLRYPKLMAIWDYLLNEATSDSIETVLHSLRAVVCPRSEVLCLEDLLVSGTDASQEFLSFATSECCDENVRFYLKVEEFRRAEEYSERERLFKEIYETFIRSGSKFEIMINSSERAALSELASPRMDSFSASENEIEVSRLQRFRGSSLETFEWDDLAEAKKLEKGEEPQQITAEVFDSAQRACFRHLEHGCYVRYRNLMEARVQQAIDPKKYRPIPAADATTPPATQEDLSSLMSALTSFSRKSSLSRESGKRSNSLGELKISASSFLFAKSNKGGAGGGGKLALNVVAEGQVAPPDSPRDLADFARGLVDVIDPLFGAHVHEGGHAVDYDAMMVSDCWSAYTNKVQQLQWIECNSMSTNASLAFWTNLYNCLIIHGVIELGAPKNAMQRTKFFSSIFYQIADYNWTPNDILHGILRANSIPPYAKKPLFEESDPRRDWSLRSIDPRVHFALVGGVKGSPCLVLYDADTVDTLLTQITALYLVSGGLQLNGNSAFQLPSFVKWYNWDFGNSDEEVMRWISQYVTDEQIRDHILRFCNSNNADVPSTPKLKLTYQKFDWSPNSITRKSPRLKKTKLERLDSFSGLRRQYRSKSTDSGEEEHALGKSRVTIGVVQKKKGSMLTMELNQAFNRSSPLGVRDALALHADLLLLFAKISSDPRDVECWIAVRDFINTKDPKLLHQLFADYFLQTSSNSARVHVCRVTLSSLMKLWEDSTTAQQQLCHSNLLHALLRTVQEELAAAIDARIYAKLLANIKGRSTTQ